MMAKHLLSVKTIYFRYDKIEGFNFLTKFSNLNSINFTYNLEKLRWLLDKDQLLNIIKIYGKYQHLSFERDDNIWIMQDKRLRKGFFVRRKQTIQILGRWLGQNH